MTTDTPARNAPARNADIPIRVNGPRAPRAQIMASATDSGAMPGTPQTGPGTARIRTPFQARVGA